MTLETHDVLVVGLGGMGAALARRIRSCGHGIVAVDVAPGARREWEHATGETALADLSAVLWRRIGRVLVAVRSPDQAMAVLDHLAAPLAGTDTACYVITTLDEETARGLARRRGGPERVIELPISGGEAAADSGALTAIAAGPVRDADIAFLTATIAEHTVVFDHYGEPTLAKLVNNVTGAYNALVAAQMLELGERLGLRPQRLYEVLLASSGASWMAAALPDLRGDLLAKDVELLARTRELPEPSLSEPRRLAERLAEAARRVGGSAQAQDQRP